MEKLSKKTKHDHTLTNILKFAIFSVIMLAPIFSVAARCLYVICNKNAKDSYSDSYVSKIQQVNNNSMFIENENYLVKYGETSQATSYGGWFKYNSISIDWTNYGFQSNTYNQFRLFNNSIVQLRDTDNTQYQMTNIWGRSLTEFTFNLKSFVSDTSSLNGNAIFYLTTYETNKLDNAFEYSLSQLEESSYYNWATNLGIYTPIYNMVNGLGGHEIIALLLAYWSIYTAIYIVFDIIIACFVKITHLLQGE